MLSVILPSYKDPYLINTIDSLLANTGGEIEIIAVLDGYWPSFELRIDDRVRYLHLGKNRGMRDAINAGVSIARGEYLMRADEHCMFCKDFDKIVLKDIKDNQIVTMRRFFLDPVKWQIMPDEGYVDYEKLVIQDNKKFSGQRWRSRSKDRADIMIDETMAMQGSCWLMTRKWWNDVIGELQTEGYGPLYQDSHEMVFKTWQAGGKMMLNKNAWFAHKHRSFARTHQHKASDTDGWIYSLNKWRDYYEKEIRPKWGI